MIELPIVVNMTLDSSKNVYDLSVEQTCETFDMGLDTTITVTINTNPYTGAYEFTPTQSTQRIEIKDLMATDDIVINPIPNNYGLIGWNGSFLTVT